MNNEYFIYAGQQLKTIENNYFFISPKWPKMIQKLQNGELDELNELFICSSKMTKNDPKKNIRVGQQLTTIDNNYFILVQNGQKWSKKTYTVRSGNDMVT